MGEWKGMEGYLKITLEVPHLFVPKSIVQVLKKTNSFFNILPCTSILGVQGGARRDDVISSGETTTTTTTFVITQIFTLIILEKFIHITLKRESASSLS